MIAHYYIKQGTEEWHQMRWGKIGGTLSKGLFTKGDGLLYDLLSEILEEFQLDEDSYLSADMLRGFELEPRARVLLSEYIGIELLECGWLQSEVNSLLGISPDGISADHSVSAEIKCPASKKHSQTILADTIPLDNLDQCIHYFTVNPKLTKHYFCSFRPENKYKQLFVKELTRESIVNIGTPAKPVMKTIKECVDLAHSEARILETQIKEAINKLEF